MAALELLMLGAATSGLTAATGRRARARERAAERRFPPGGKLLEIGGRRLHAEVMGPAQGCAPDLVLIHGASGNARDFTFSLGKRLAGAFRVIAFDRPGLGWSDPLGPEGRDPAAQARHLLAGAQALGVRRAVVLGQSYGGAVALAWALEAPESVAALVLVAAASHPWPGDLGAWYRLTRNGLGRRLAIPLVAAYAGAGRIRRAIEAVFAPDPVPEGYAAHLGVGLTLRRRALRENAAQVNALRPYLAAMAPRYPALACPVEILHGTADTTVPLAVHSEPLARAVTGASLIRLDGAGHMPHHSREDETVAAIHRAADRARLH